MANENQENNNNPMNDPDFVPSATPISDSVTAQYDEWDKELDAWRAGNRELLNKKLEEMRKSIENWVNKKKEELQKEEKEVKESVLGKIILEIMNICETIKKAIDDMGSALGDVIEVIKKFSELLQQVYDLLYEIMSMFAGSVFDIIKAGTIITVRTPITLSKCRPI